MSSVVQVLLALGDYMNVQCHTCIGGTNVGEDIRKLDYGQHVVAGTPGRVFGEFSIGFLHSCPSLYCASAGESVRLHPASTAVER